MPATEDTPSGPRVGDDPDSELELDPDPDRAHDPDPDPDHDRAHDPDPDQAIACRAKPVTTIAVPPTKPLAVKRRTAVACGGPFPGRKGHHMLDHPLL